MNMQFRFKVSGIFIIFALLLASTPTHVAHSQTGGEYTCGQFQRLDAGTRGFPAFVPFGSENNPSAWWIIGTLNQMIPVTSTGEEISPNYGQYIRVWYPEFDSYSDTNQYLISISSYEFVDTCAPAVTPILDFYVDNTKIYAGECTTLYWNTNSVYQQVFLDSTNGPVVSGDGHAPASGSTVVCPSFDSTYRLTGVYDTTQDYKDITIYVIQPTNTPIPPTATRIPTKTPIPSTSTPRPTSTSIPPTLAPTATPYDGPLPNDGYEPSPSWLDKISQFFAPPVEASYSPADCQQRFYEGQCTWFVAGKRPDACQWIASGMGNAYQWASQAKQKNASDLGINVSNVPHEGDIVVWSADCGGTSSIPQSGEPCTIGASGNYEGCGHVAYVTWASSDGKTINIEEMNWSIDRSNKPLEVLKCMSFISSPSEKNATSPSPAPTNIATPNPVIVPTPSGEPSTFNPFQWIIDLFK
jgi:surface antigen